MRVRISSFSNKLRCGTTLDRNAFDLFHIILINLFVQAAADAQNAAIEEFEANKPTTTPGDQQAEARIT